MNRSQRRRQQNQSKDQLLAQMERNSIVAKQRETFIKEKAITETMTHATEMLLTVTALTLRDELDFGHKRVSRVLNRIESKMGSILSGHASFEDMRQCVEDELNIIISAKFRKDDENGEN